jgi:protocatechuate 3,4-dioxygenase beta subunit
MQNNIKETDEQQPALNRTPTYQSPNTPTLPPTKKSSPWLPIVITVVVLAAVIAGVWYAIQSQTSQQQSSADENVTISGTTSDKEASTSPFNLAAAAASTAACGYTTETTQGPYFVTDTSELSNNNLNYNNLPGEPIKIGGYVYGSEANTKPVANAKIEIWQADSFGNYHPNTSGNAADFDTEQISLRGYVRTDASGYYEFTSIYPGEYSDRARHIHVRVTAEDYSSIVSQIILSLPGDQVQASQDTIAQTLNLSCAQPTFTTVDDTQEGVYNFHIKS